MWSEKSLKVIPAIAFLFCLLDIFELALIANGMNKTEKLEEKLQKNLEELENVIFINKELRKHMYLEYFQDKKIKIK